MGFGTCEVHDKKVILDAIGYKKSKGYIDIFEDEKVLGAGKRSLSYSVYFQDDARTLTDDEINKLQDQIRNTLVKKLGVELK